MGDDYNLPCASTPRWGRDICLEVTPVPPWFRLLFHITVLVLRQDSVLKHWHSESILMPSLKCLVICIQF